MSKTTWIIMLLVIIAAVVYLNGTGIFVGKPALKIVVTTGFDETGSVKVTNATFEQISLPFYYKKADIPAKFPEINIFGRIDNMSSAPSSFWAAVYRPEDNGVYTLTMTFKDGKEPKNGSLLILPIRLTDLDGYTIYKTTAFYQWE
jgi:hypothetical protein